MSGGQKIIEGLKQALRYARCRHEFTYWVPGDPDPKRIGMMMSRSWSRRCTKCKVKETRFSEAEPAN